MISNTYLIHINYGRVRVYKLPNTVYNLKQIPIRYQSIYILLGDEKHQTLSQIEMYLADFQNRFSNIEDTNLNFQYTKLVRIDSVQVTECQD